MISSAEPERRFVYGPVPSRRLRRSLGVDLVPFKTCTYDCIYCQLGRTTDKTLERREYVPTTEVLAELGRALAHGAAPDYISLAGSGEPTLHSGIGRLLKAIKDITDVPVAVITNGSLLRDDSVQEELLQADLVLPSLDAGDAATFAIVNRPHRVLSFELMVEGLRAFTRRFAGEVWLEVMLLAGLTDTSARVKSIAALAGEIAPARTQLNTATRPAVGYCARPVPLERLTVLAGLFTGQVDLVSDFAQQQETQKAPDDETGGSRDVEIITLLRRRPCTAEDVAAGLGLHVLDALKRLEDLTGRRKVIPTMSEGKVFYLPANQEEQS